MEKIREIGERVVFSFKGEEIVGTITQYLDNINDLYILQTGYDEENFKALSRMVTGSELISATHEHLNNIGDYRTLIPVEYHVGSKLRPNGKVNIDSIGSIRMIEIKNVNLSTNALLDTYEVEYYGEKGNLIDKLTSTSLNRDFVVDSDEEIQEEILDMLDDSGENDIVLQKGIRAKVEIPYFYNEEEITNLIGVIYQIDEANKKVTLCFNTSDQLEILEEFDFADISIATLEQINSVNYEFIVDSDYYIGTSFKAKKDVNDYIHINKKVQEGDVVTIVHVNKLDHNVVLDTFMVENEKKERFILSTYDLHSCFEIVFDRNIKNEEPVEEPTKQDALDEPENLSGVVIHSLTVDGFTFHISAQEKITCENEITKSNVNSFIQALHKLQRVIQ